MSIYTRFGKYVTLWILSWMLHGCGNNNEVNNPADQKKQEVINSINFLLDKQQISYPTTTSCVVELLQIHTEKIQTITTLLQCGWYPTWSHEIKKDPRVKNHPKTEDTQDFIVEMRIPNITTTSSGMLDAESGCLQAFIYTGASWEKMINTCQEPWSSQKKYTM